MEFSDQLDIKLFKEVNVNQAKEAQIIEDVECWAVKSGF